MPQPGNRTITIRTAILRGSLVLVLVAITLSGSLSFIEFRQALQSEIAHNLGSSASGLLERIDAFFFERLVDLREWRRVELMQDIKVGDVDKRLARLLYDLKSGHGDVYSTLYCTNQQGKIVAASDPHLIGINRPVGHPMKYADQWQSDVVVLEHTAANTPEGAGQFTLRAAIPDAFGHGTLGYLFAVLNWNVVQQFLTDDIKGGAETALLLDTDNQIIAASGGLSTALKRHPFKFPDKTWKDDYPHIKIRSGEIEGAGDLLVGAAASLGYQHFSGFGWHMLVVEPTEVAFAPVWNLTWVILAGLLFSLAVASWLSIRLSMHLASPIGALTEFARNFRRGQSEKPPLLQSRIREVGELNRAFIEMIDALEQSREHIVRAGKLAVVGEMAAIMAHEVRTPLGILKSSAQMLERQQNLSPLGRELTGFIVSETERLNRLVTSLLECATPRSPQFQPNDVHEIILHTLLLVSTKSGKKNIVIESRLEAQQSIFSCDREQIIQVFLNLIINAIQHVPDSGKIRLKSFDEGDATIFLVEDDGPGILSLDRPKIFDPFFTRREGGIGLGLTIVQQIVHSHEGTITLAESAMGGAVFAIRLWHKQDEATK
ncbi:MAG TPA: ATP-binding protein [Halothiobacillus sp.]|nr:ATP-binding protein [Halothiobacillus sp.]